MGVAVIWRFAYRLWFRGTFRSQIIILVLYRRTIVLLSVDRDVWCDDFTRNGIYVHVDINHQHWNVETFLRLSSMDHRKGEDRDSTWTGSSLGLICKWHWCFSGLSKLRLLGWGRRGASSLGLTGTGIPGEVFYCCHRPYLGRGAMTLRSRNFHRRDYGREALAHF